MAGESFWSRQTFWYRWVPLLTSSVTLWILVTMLALWAMRKRRARDAACAGSGREDRRREGRPLRRRLWSRTSWSTEAPSPGLACRTFETPSLNEIVARHRRDLLVTRTSPP